MVAMLGTWQKEVDREIAYFSPTHAWDDNVVYSFVDYSCVHRSTFLGRLWEKNGLKVRKLDGSGRERDAPFEAVNVRSLTVGRNPVWSHDGKRVSFKDKDGFLTAEGEVKNIKEAGLDSVLGYPAWVER